MRRGVSVDDIDLRGDEGWTSAFGMHVEKVSTGYGCAPGNDGDVGDLSISDL